ncbi:MAG: ABC transporter ATP-binding protein [Bacteroidales bacterium]
MLAELQNISKHYNLPGAVTGNIILNQLSLNIGATDSIAVVGPSGSGKSTLLNILGTLDQPTSGNVILDGINVNELDDNHLAGIRNQMIGFVFQLHHLLPQLTLLENVLLPVVPVKERVARTQAIERAHQLIERVGLKKQVNQRPYQLSVGECQRVAVARALVNQPRLLLADEPTGSLDAENARLLGQLLIELHRDAPLAIVVVTHSMELASLMSITYRLTSGKLQRINPS